MQITLKFLAIIMLSVCLSGCATFRNCDSFTDDPIAQRYCLADQGDEEAQYNIAVDTMELGDTKNAIKWLEKAAEPKSDRIPDFIPTGNNGDVRIQMYERGPKTPGHKKAQLLLGKIYEEGLGVDVDINKAKKYRKMAGN